MAEYRSLAQATAEVMWIQTLLTELSIPFTNPAVFCDNQSVVAITHNPILFTPGQIIWRLIFSLLGRRF